MDANAYQQFLELERDHWWFRSRRTLYFDLGFSGRLAELAGSGSS